ncbi:MAG: hypothetical protein KFF77_11980 [Bacteroidetes bacterium]|nr:hypothetical protein [Bacteroidota bacterium]
MRLRHPFPGIAAALLFAFAVLFAVGCDFPSDPPLKDTTIVPPIDEPADTLSPLLPLHRGVQWVYQHEQQGRPPSMPRMIVPRPLEYDGIDFHYVLYAAYMGGPGGVEVAFPVLLRNDSIGLAFHQPLRMEDTSGISIRPKYIFTLPYPGRIGRFHEGQNPEYRVRLTHRDTLVTMFNYPVSLLCHRYEVWKGQRLTSVLYVVPGLCILRIEEERRIYHTISWNI